MEATVITNETYTVNEVASLPKSFSKENGIVSVNLCPSHASEVFKVLSTSGTNWHVEGTDVSEVGLTLSIEELQELADETDQNALDVLFKYISEQYRNFGVELSSAAIKAEMFKGTPKADAKIALYDAAKSIQPFADEFVLKMASLDKFNTYYQALLEQDAHAEANPPSVLKES